jgi:chorismate mutase
MIRDSIALVSLTTLLAALGAPTPVAADIGRSAPPGTTALGRLTELAVQRIEISGEVAAAKYGTGTPIDDPVREREQLDRVRRDAVAMGLAPAATVMFFRAQIAASKIVQAGLFRRWAAHPGQAPAVRPVLSRIRVRLDRLTKEMLQELKATQVIRRDARRCHGELSRLAREADDGLDRLQRKALATALGAVCANNRK